MEKKILQCATIAVGLITILVCISLYYLPLMEEQWIMANDANVGQDTIEIEGDLVRRVIKIKATGKVAWGVCIGALGIGGALFSSSWLFELFSTLFSPYKLSQFTSEFEFPSI